MEPTLLYGFPLGSSMGLVASLEWLGQPYRLSRVDMLNEMKTPEYLRLNPRGETPVLLPGDGRVVTETMAIAAWIEAHDRERRISFDPGTARADRMHQLIGFINTGFTAAFTPYWVALEMEDGSAEYKAALRQFGHRLVNDRHARMEELIGDTPYLMGDRPTLADGVFIGVARWGAFHQAVQTGDYPKTQALIARLMADPAVAFAQAREDGETPPGSGALLGEVPLAEVLRDHR